VGIGLVPGHGELPVPGVAEGGDGPGSGVEVEDGADPRRVDGGDLLRRSGDDRSPFRETRRRLDAGDPGDGAHEFG
jgi:hypothetical protein